MDQNGRTSLRQIVTRDRDGRPSLLNVNQTSNQLSSAQSGPSLKFVRKSDLSQDIYSNKSVISIKGEREVSIKYGAATTEELHQNLNFSYTQAP